METEELTILGYSDAFLTMLFDITTNKNIKYKILDNLNLHNKNRIYNPKIKYEIVNELNSFGKFLYGSAKTSTRKKIMENFKIDDNKLETIIDESCVISKTTSIGKGCVINPLCVIAGQSVISNNVFINRLVSIGHHTSIGENTSINPGVNIAGNVKIGKNCQIGIGATIIDNINIGDNTIIGAGSIVTKDIPNNVIAYGNPCKIIRKNNE